MTTYIPDPKVEAYTDAYNNWVDATSRLEAARRELSSAETVVANARNALGRTLCPDKAKEGDCFNVWINGKLLTVTYVRFGDYTVEFWKAK